MATRLLLQRASSSWPGSANQKVYAAIRPATSFLRTSPRSGALGSSLGTDSSMIAANDRCFSTFKLDGGPTANSYWNRLGRKDSSMIAANNRCFSSNTTGGAMQDEYGEMTSDGYTYVHPTPMTLENGQVLEEAQLRYQTYGELNEARDNVLVICHALTGNASLHSWWGDLLGPGKAFDTNRYLVVCSNILGSCYGSTGPSSINPSTGQPYGKEFPDISVKDTVRLQLYMLVNALKVQSIQSVIGGSFGGMQAMEFAVQAGNSASSPFAGDCFFMENDTQTPLLRTVIPIACGAAHTAWQIAISETQRQAIYADHKWQTNGLEATQGLAVARQIGMVSYRTAKGYCQKFGRSMQTAKNNNKEAQYGSAANWKVKSYLEYQGEKFLSRFDPITYVKMTEQMDSHDVARGRGDSLASVLSHVKIPALVLGIDSDLLYPLEEQQELAEHLTNSELHVIHSDDGHDGFLLEQEQVANHITTFLSKHD
jgi:homoserine O-acetyltransferase/O-succinyltransferase